MRNVPIGTVPQDCLNDTEQLLRVRRGEAGTCEVRASLTMHPAFAQTMPEPQVTNGNFAPAMPDFNVPNTTSFEGKEDELLSMLESELFPQAQKPKKTFFQKLIGK